MAHKIQVSRHGLTRCPSCQAHIQVAAAARDTACPFCGASLVAALNAAAAASPRPGLLRAALAHSRSGLLAASLLGVSVAAAGCGDEEEPAPTEDTTSADTSVDTSPDPNDITAQPAYGEPADTFNPPDGALYGGPPDDVTTEDTPDNGAVDLYGLPPDSSP